MTLDQAIFLALSGGQESDRGAVDGKPVQEAHKDGKEIVYDLEEGHGLVPDQAVAMVIDWARRYRLMRLHFAA